MVYSPLHDSQATGDRFQAAGYRLQALSTINYQLSTINYEPVPSPQSPVRSREFPVPSPQSLVPAFTLVELVIVVVILGIIAAIAVPKFGQAAAKAQAKRVAATLQTINAATQQYFHDHDAFPGCENLPSGSLECLSSKFQKQISLKTGKDGCMTPGSNCYPTFGPYFDINTPGCEDADPLGPNDYPFPPNPYYSFSSPVNRRNDVYLYCFPPDCTGSWQGTNYNWGWIFNYDTGDFNVYLGADPNQPANGTPPASISLNELINLAAPAPISFNHPALQ